MPVYFPLSSCTEKDTILFGEKTTYLNPLLFLQDGIEADLGSRRVCPCFLGEQRLIGRQQRTQHWRRWIVVMCSRYNVKG